MTLLTSLDFVSEAATIKKFKDSSECEIVFNVMPNRPVREQLKMREFRIGATWIEAEFDRSYHSSMLNSPSHLTFIAALIQMQKIVYVYSCHKLRLDPDVEKSETLKIWPTSASLTMKDLVREEKSIVHRIDFHAFRKVESKKYFTRLTSIVGIMEIDVSGIIILLEA